MVLGAGAEAGCRHGRGTSLGQECHLVAINSYYVVKSISHPSLQLPNTSPAYLAVLRKQTKRCIFCVAKIIRLWVPKAVLCRPQQLLLAAVPWQLRDVALAQERGLWGLCVSHKQSRSRPSHALLCRGLRQLYPVPSAPCVLSRRCDALPDRFLSQPAAVALP